MDVLAKLGWDVARVWLRTERLDCVGDGVELTGGYRGSRHIGICFLGGYLGGYSGRLGIEDVTRIRPWF